MPESQQFIPDELYQTIVKLLPVVSVDIIPARCLGDTWEIGIITRATGQEANKPALIGGRIMYNESVHDAIARHLQKDCALTSFTMQTGNSAEHPFYVQQYAHGLRAESLAGFDPSKHSIGLTYIISIDKEPAPRDEASGFYWINNETVPENGAYNQQVLMKAAFDFLNGNGWRT